MSSLSRFTLKRNCRTRKWSTGSRRRIQLPGLPPVDVDVDEIGKIVLQGNTQRIRPAIPGYSVGRAVETKEAGTFGLVVRRQGEQSPLYLLSNSHAIAASGFADKGDVIVQPGGYDGGKAPADSIGTLADWVPLIFSATGFPNLVDAAIATLDPGVASPAIAVLGVPKGVNTKLTRGAYVRKMGRTTTLSAAIAQDVDFRVSSTYPDGSGKLGRVGILGPGAGHVLFGGRGQRLPGVGHGRQCRRAARRRLGHDRNFLQDRQRDGPIGR